MRVLWLGDAVCSSGFARCTHAVCDELHRRGHEVHVVGINFYGYRPEDDHYPYPVYPSLDLTDGGQDSHGVTRLPHLIQRLHPDVVVILQDPWNIKSYIDTIDAHWEKYGLQDTSVPPIVGWLAVDAENQQAESLDRLSEIITWTQFGANELRKAGYEGDISVVPLGVDTDIFFPRPRSDYRRKIAPEGRLDDAFIVGAVGRNQLRKRHDLTLRYFHKWVERYDIEDAYLFLHIGPTAGNHVDPLALIKYYGLQGKVILSIPEAGRGQPTKMLPSMYSSFDVYLSTTQGEGWGLPALEAMACGVPCILPNWSAFGEWAKGHACLIPCTSTALSAPLSAGAYTLGGIPDEDATVGALDSLYHSTALRKGYETKGLECAGQFEWRRSAQQMADEVTQVLLRQELAVGS